MYYAPHTLQKRIDAEESTDELGRPVVADSTEAWVDVCRCRCDHNGEKEIKMPDGKVIRPDYHVVLDENDPGLRIGDYVRCINDYGNVRGEGHVLSFKTLNYLPYAEVYL